MMDPAQDRIDAHLNAHDDWMEAPATERRENRCGETAGASSCDPLLVDFANRLDYWVRTDDPRAWTAPGPASTRSIP